MAKTLMIQGTGSNVGKSLIVAGLARAFARRGLEVRPFKPQNMSKPRLMERVLESFARVGAGADLVLVEGAGSPAEINLRSGDIANMGFAEAAGIPVILLGDIDRGGVIAQLVGTHAVLSASDRARVRGFAINRFRGDPALFAEGEAEITRRSAPPAHRQFR